MLDKLEDAYDAICGPVSVLATIIGVVAAIGWFYYCVGPHHEAFEHAAQKKYPITMATVTKVGSVHGTEAANAYRPATISFQDHRGQPHTRDRLMSWQEHIGQRTPIVIGPKGSVYVYYEVGRGAFEDSNPRHPSDDAILFNVVIVTIPVGVIAGLVSFWGIAVLLIGLSALVELLWWLVTKPALMKLAWRKVRLAIRRTTDEMKLRWEFRRRRKRLRATAAYRAVRRFQAELGRMDPTPKVHQARRKANELLTAVLDRDNTRVEVINGTIDEIRKDVDLDARARREAHEELRAQEA